MKIIVELNLSSKEIDALFTDCLIARNGVIVNGVELKSAYRQIEDALRKLQTFLPETKS